MKKFLVFLIAAFALTGALATSGCALLTANTATVSAINAGVQLITSLYIQKKGGDTPAGQSNVATQLAAAATSLQGLATGNLTVAQFNSAMAVYIDKLTNPTEKILVSELLMQLDIYFNSLIAQKGSVLTVTTSAVAQAVLSDVIATCAFYIQAPSIKVMK